MRGGEGRRREGREAACRDTAAGAVPLSSGGLETTWAGLFLCLKWNSRGPWGWKGGGDSQAGLRLPSALTWVRVGKWRGKTGTERPRHFSGDLQYACTAFSKSLLNGRTSAFHMKRRGLGSHTRTKWAKVQADEPVLPRWPSYLCLTWRGAETAWGFPGTFLPESPERPFHPILSPRWDVACTLLEERMEPLSFNGTQLCFSFHLFSFQLCLETAISPSGGLEVVLAARGGAPESPPMPRSLSLEARGLVPS